MLGGENKAHIGRIKGEAEATLKPRHGAPRRHENKAETGHTNHDGNIAHRHHLGYWQGRDHGGDAQNQQNIGNIAADNIADGQTGMAARGGNQ